MGRRRLIPNFEQVICNEPIVTPIISAISSRTLSPLYEVADLLHPFWSKPRWPSTIEGLQFELNGLDHYSISLSLFSEAVEMTESACRPCVEKWCTPSDFSPTRGEMATFCQKRCGDMKEPGHFGLMYTLGAAHKLQSLF